jgi:hypothetical protein
MVKIRTVFAEVAARCRAWAAWQHDEMEEK